MPNPFALRSSTKLPIDDTSAPAAPTLGDPKPDDELGEPGLTLTTEQIAQSGLTDLQPGDSFSVTITATVKDNSNGITADITDASNGERTSAEPGGDNQDQDMKERFPSAKDAGFEFGNAEY